MGVREVKASERDRGHKEGWDERVRENSRRVYA